MRLSHFFRPRDVVVSSLAGGLGNQLFQYAFGRAVATRLKCELVLDTRILQIKEGQTPRDYALAVYQVKATVDTLSRKQLDRCIVAKEKTSNYDAQVLPHSVPGCRLSGYWQTEKYFAHIRPQLLDELTLREQTSHYINGIAEQIKASQSVSIHFRRGDYVTDPNIAAYHGTCDLSYYSAAIQKLQSAEPELRFFMFSDDPQWLESNIPPGISSLIVDARQSSAREDLWLMSLCKHHIIANSSFSWWGAWLGQRQGINITPRKWFSSASFNDIDVVPQTWHRL